MKALIGAIGLAAVVGVTDASAQGVNLSGRWQCVALCLAPIGSYAYVTQYGWNMNIVNEAGVPYRAWVDYPGHIWVDRDYQGAIFSPDGMTLHFDRGTVWQRAPELPPPPPPPPLGAAKLQPKQG